VVSAPDGMTQTPWTIVNSEPPAPPPLPSFAQVFQWGASLPGHERMTFGVIMADYLREVQHLSPAQVEADMRKTRGLLLCTLDNFHSLRSLRAARLAAIRSRHGIGRPAVNPACWK
jgi:hypothetical protein